MTIYIIRHGETDYNKRNMVQGKIDTLLNRTGWEQGKLFHEYHKNIDFDLILTSSLRRTHQTVDPFIRRNRDRWVQMDALDEISWGAHEGQAYAPALQSAYENMMQGWESENYHTKIEGGESAHELAERVQTVVDYLRASTAKNVLVCTHGRTLLCLITLLKGEPLKNMNLYKHQNTGLYVVHRLNGEFIFEVENDARHLNK